MSEDKMIEIVQEAMADQGIDDEVTAVGEFLPRGTVGAGEIGGLVGSSAGDLAGNFAGSIAGAAGFIAGMRRQQAASGLPRRMLVGVSPKAVYGFVEHTRHKEPGGLVFRAPRDKLTVKVHQRLNVRVLELIEDDTGAAIELEGSRIPVTHANDVFKALGH
ncbi:MAG TPA: hypothetical protein VEX15_20960 [Nocardioidaceae bacterium]|nr:hypothetical protein [Nocardioidaceae bacterium]